MDKTDSTAKGKIEAIRSEQRKSQRYAKELGVHLYWLDESGDLEDLPATVKDISADGFGIESPRSFTLGQLVSVSTLAGSLQCEVRHVSGPRDELYRIGMRILSASDGSNHKRSLESLAAAASDEMGDESQH